MSRWFGQLLIALESHAHERPASWPLTYKSNVGSTYCFLVRSRKLLFTASDNKSVEIRAEACSRGDHLGIA